MGIEERLEMAQQTVAQVELAVALEDLRASEELTSRIIDSSRDCIKVLDLDGRLLSMNAGGMAVLEICDLGPFLHSSWIDFWENEDRERAAAAVAAARRGEVGRFIGYFPTTQTHTPMWFDVIVSPICDAAGKPERLLALSRDVTELKRAEDELRRAHGDLARKVAERTASLAAANAALQRVVEGVESEIGDRFATSLVRHLAGALSVQYAFVSELSEDGQRFRTRALWGRGSLMDNLEVPVAGTPCEAVLNGEIAHYPEQLQESFPQDVALVEWGVHSYCGVPLSDGSGRVNGHVAILDDKPMPDATRALSIMRIFAVRAQAENDRVRAERALRDSEQRLARVLDSAMDAIVTFDAARRIALFNNAAEKIFGCPSSAALGQSLDTFLTDELSAALAASMRGFDGGAHVHPYVWAPGGLNARRRDGGAFPVEATISHVEVGGAPLYTLILRDVDQRRRAESELRQLSLHREYLEEEIKAVHNFGEIIGHGASIAALLDQVQLVADTDSSVLVLGETGTGKELVARAVHSHSRRRNQPLIKVNCAALPAGLIESELFGHERGAFTGASERRIGRFELAQRGTIFLDEVGELPLDVQVKLLRVLQEREIERVGGTGTITVDVRLIAATNRDLARAVAEGTFRADLYYRLNVFPLSVPPLRDRSEDIPLLVHYFVGRFAAKVGRKITRVPKDVMQRLSAYPWPGNVRELENVIERAVILTGGPNLEVPPQTFAAVGERSDAQAARAVQVPAAVQPSPPAISADATSGNGQELVHIERNHILAVLERVSWRIEGPDGAAQILKMNPSTLRSRMKKLGVQRRHRPLGS